MSVIAISEHWKGRNGDFAGISDSKSVRRWLILVDNKADDETTIVDSGLLPPRFSVHPNNVYLTSRRLKLEQHADSPYAWEATAEYSSTPLTLDEEYKELHPNPADRPARVKIKAELRQIAAKDAIVIDFTTEEETLGRWPIVNSAGDAFDPPPEVDDLRWSIEVEVDYNEPPEWFWTLGNCVNEEEVIIRGRTCPPRTLKLSDLKMSELKKENGYEFYTINFELHFRLGPEERDFEDSWLIEPLDRGFNWLNVDPLTLEITKAEILLKGARPAEPQLLDGIGVPIDHPKPGQGVFLKYRYYKDGDFGLLPELL